MSVQTITGRISPENLGFTLPHEHLKVDCKKFYIKAPIQCKDILAENQITLKNLNTIRQYPYSNWCNISYDDSDSHEACFEDVLEFKKCGGGTIVDNTVIGGSDKDFTFLKSLCNEIGVKIVIGTGFYIEKFQQQDIISKSVEDMYDLMLTELTVGCVDDGSVKAGIIGEIGSNWPISDFEKRAIRAAGLLNADINAPVSFHPGRSPEAPTEILRIFMEAGGNKEKVVMCHLCRTFQELEDLLEFAHLGTYCQFDLFGVDCAHYQLNETFNMPNDGQRISLMKALIDDGKEDKLTMSHDLHTKHRLRAFGGHGFSHIMTNVIPMMITRGITKDTIDMITIKNPADWLTTSY